VIVRFQPEAREELREAALFYNRQQKGLGQESRQEVARAIEHIRALPEACQALGDGFRRHRLDRFPYGVLDKLWNNQVIIVAVAHASRDPGYWRDRV
jgi:toxin ParE1/3/4